MNRLEEILSLTKNSPNRLRESFFIKNDIELFNKIVDFSKNLDLIFKQRVWHYVNNESNYIKCYCGNSLRFKNNWKMGYNEYCSTKCASNNEKYKEDVKNTLLQKYGVTHYSKTSEYKQKIKKTSLDRYGVDNYSKTSDYITKSKKTYLEKYGVDSYTKTKEYLQKSKNTNIGKYGVDSHTKTNKYSIDRKGKSIFKNEEYRTTNFNLANNEFYIKYLGNGISLFNCDNQKKHTFEINTDNYYGRLYNSNSICTICNPISARRSIKETELYNFIKQNHDGDIIENYKDKYEIDIYLPRLNIGFEFNGIWWHSNRYKEESYHLDKTNHFKEKGIRIIHIWEDDWLIKKDILKYQILNLINKIENKVYARKCKISLLDTEDSREFLDKNHIQGFVESNIKIGLFYNNILVSIMCFEKLEEFGWNINRFCSKNDILVIGAASKLLSFFIKNYKPRKIVTYVDKDWSIGDMYFKIGFNKVCETKPDYKYLVNNTREHKSNFLDTDVFRYKVYDCGKIKFEKII